MGEGLPIRAQVFSKYGVFMIFCYMVIVYTPFILLRKWIIGILTPEVGVQDAFLENFWMFAFNLLYGGYYGILIGIARGINLQNLTAIASVSINFAVG